MGRKPALSSCSPQRIAHALRPSESQKPNMSVPYPARPRLPRSKERVPKKCKEQRREEELGVSRSAAKIKVRAQRESSRGPPSDRAACPLSPSRPQTQPGSKRHLRRGERGEWGAAEDQLTPSSQPSAPAATPPPPDVERGGPVGDQQRSLGL